MIYSAIGLAVMGAAVGLVFRWKVLLPVIALIPVGAIVFSISGGLSYRDTAIVIVVAEALLQGGYFVGLLIRFVSTAGMRSAGSTGRFKSRRDRGISSEDRRTAPPAEAGKGP